MQSNVPAIKLFPARAGVILWEYACATGAAAIPRTRGGDPTMTVLPRNSAYYFPHARG